MKAQRVSAGRSLRWSLQALVLALAAVLVACGGRAATPVHGWERPSWEPGGEKALLFFLVYGEIDPSSLRADAKYRTAGVPAKLQATAMPRTVDPCAAFLTGEPWNAFQQEEPETAAVVGRAASCTILRGQIDDPRDLHDLRDVIGVITSALDHGGIAVYDPQTFRWWTPKQWKARVFDPGGLVIGTQVMHFGSPDDSHPGTFWHYTHGLRKLGRPDLSVHGASAADEKAIGKAIERLVGWQVDGRVFHDGQTLDGPDLPLGLKVHLQGSLEDPDFNNVHWEIEWPQAAKQP